MSALPPKRTNSQSSSHVRFVPKADMPGSSGERSHSTNVFLNHSQMRLESLQIDFECTRNPDQPHVRFNFGNSLLILDQSGCVRALRKFAFEISQGPMQLVYTTNVEPSVNARRESDQRDQRHNDRNDKERYSAEE